MKKTITQWLCIVIATLGCLYFLYDNILFLINFHTWVPDRELHFWTSISMITASIITLFNLLWLILVIHTKRPPITLMKPFLAISGALSLIFVLSLATLILLYLTSEPIELSTVLITIFTLSVIGVVVRLWKVTFLPWRTKQIT